MIMGLGGTIPLLVWAFFLKPDSSVLVIYGMTLLGGVAYACDQVINTPFLQTTMPKRKLQRGPGMIAFAGSTGGTICGAVAGSILKQRRPYGTIALSKDLSGIPESVLLWYLQLAFWA